MSDNPHPIRTIAMLSTLAMFAMVSACADEVKEESYSEKVDPIVIQALSDQLMVDPDLVGQNEANAALTTSTDQSVPLIIATPDAIRDARDKADTIIAEAGGSVTLPEPELLDETPVPSPLASLPDQAAQLLADPKCIASARYSTVWAARLPQYLPVYPRGATVEALGSDRKDCRLRAVRFHSPVPMEHIAEFYFTIAARSGFSPRTFAAEDTTRIEGSRGTERIVIWLRPSLEGVSEIDLIVAGQ